MLHRISKCCWLACVAVLLPGCNKQLLVAQFSHDFGCSEEDIRIHKIKNDSNSVRVWGCGQSARYYCRNGRCRSPVVVVATRQSKELGCEPADVEVRDLGSGAYVADGCGEKATYQCGVDSQYAVRCVLETKQAQADETQKVSDESKEDDHDMGFGTCFAVTPDGQVITAAHVVSDATRVRAGMIGEAFQDVELLFIDHELDVAVLKLDAATPHYLRLAPPEAVATGDVVFTMGFPVADWLGVEPKFTDGSVSAVGAAAGNARLIQMTVPIQPGNSGGPLVNEAGTVVGVVTSSAAVASFFKRTGTLPQGINFAIDTSDLQTRYGFPPTSLAPEKESLLGRRELVERVRGALCAVETTL